MMIVSETLLQHYRHHYEGYNNDDGNIHNDDNNRGDNR